MQGSAISGLRDMLKPETRRTRAFRSIAITFAAVLICTLRIGTAAADDLASNATNPAAALIQMQFQDLIIPESQGIDGAANSFIVQPVYPIVLGPDHFFGSIITRTTIPLVTTAKLPQAGAGTKRTTGLGDTTVLIVPVKKMDTDDIGGFLQWGPVVTTILPTATKQATGSGKWSLGGGGLLFKNSVNVFTDGDSLLLGVLGYNIWDVAETRSGSADVNKFFGQPVVVYHFDDFLGEEGWYTGLPDDLWTYDWNLDRFTQIPVGARLGKVFAIGKQPVNVFGQAWWNAANSIGAPEWTVKINMTLLFPAG